MWPNMYFQVGLKSGKNHIILHFSRNTQGISTIFCESMNLNIIHIVAKFYVNHIGISRDTEEIAPFFNFSIVNPKFLESTVTISQNGFKTYCCIQNINYIPRNSFPAKARVLPII